MTPQELSTTVGRSGLSQGKFAAQLGVDRSTLNKWMRGASPIPAIADWAIRGWIALNQRPAPRRKKNTRVPKPLSVKACPECGGALWFPHSRGEKRRGIEGRVYSAVCKTHKENRAACSVTMLHFDAQGSLLKNIPKFSPRPFKKLSFKRPRCPECGMEMLSTRPATCLTLISKGEMRKGKVLGFVCKGGRWNKPKHKPRTVYTNKKGGIQQVHKGAVRKFHELPIQLRQNFPKCCGKPLTRERHYFNCRLQKRLWGFRCRTCGKQKWFDDSAKPHTPYQTNPRGRRQCPHCGKNLKRGEQPKAHPELLHLVCNRSGVPHEKRGWYFHRKNGCEYICTVSGRSPQYAPGGSKEARSI